MEKQDPNKQLDLSGTRAPEHSKKLLASTTGRRAFIAGSLGTLGVASLGGGWAYNRFLREHTEISDVASYEAQATTASNSTSNDDTALTGMAVTDTGLTAENGSLTLKTIVLNEGTSEQVTAYTAEIKLGSASILRSAFAQNQFGLNIVEKPSVIASVHKAIWAINGDYYGFRESGIVVRNGVVYRDLPARDGLAFYSDGSVRIYDETATNAQELVNEGVLNTVSFGPALVEKGTVRAGIDEVEVDTNFGNHSIQGNQPRTAVGAISENHLLFMVVDGRSEGYSRGVTMTELAQMMLDAGCVTAYNLDGGGSSAMIFNSALVNNPLGKGKERETSDILYIAGA